MALSFRPPVPGTAAPDAPLIGAAEAARMAAGTPAILAEAAMPGLDGLTLLVLRPRDGVLRGAGIADSPPRPMPAGLRPLAILARDAAQAQALADGLPEAVPRLVGAEALAGLANCLADALAEAQAALLASQLATTSTRTLVLDLQPGADLRPPPARVSLHLGRPAEAICSVALHVGAVRATAASLLRARLVAGGRVLGAWAVPGDGIGFGWLALDLPEPAPPGPAPALLEVAVEEAAGELLSLSTADAAPGGDAEPPLALRAETAGPGHRVLPRFFDWAACDLPAPAPGLLLPLPEGVWEAAHVEGATHRLVAAGAEPPRLVLELEAGAEAWVTLPLVPPGAADLALGEFNCQAGDPAGLAARLLAGPEATPSAIRSSGWRTPDARGALRMALPLPPGLGGALQLAVSLRNRGAGPVVLELSTLGLMAGSAGAPRRVPAPPAGLAGAPGAPTGIVSQPPRLALMLPGRAAHAAEARPGLARPPVPLAPVAPPPPPAEAGAPPPPAAAQAAPALAPPPAAPLAAEMPPGGADFHDSRLHQHTVNADGTYQHLDLSLTGLVSAIGAWRELRLKLFERRGVVGLEFRRIKGWPAIFESWPAGGSDQYGPYWRLETEETAAAMAKLATGHDRALIATVLEVLPGVARRVARLAGLPADQQEAWCERGRLLGVAVDATRPGQVRPAP